MRRTGIVLTRGVCAAVIAAGMLAALSQALPARAQAQKGTSKKAQSLPASEEVLKFSRDIAPILAANCVRCHNPNDKARRKNFDLSTFEGLMAGGDDGAVIVPGKPDQSMLILRIRGEEGAKMPPGQNDLARETIAKIEAWVKAGARLDAGVNPRAPLQQIAPSAEDRRQMELAKLAPEERDRRIEEAGRERWKKATAKSPEVTKGSARFMLLSTLPADRAKSLLKSLDATIAMLANVLGPDGNKVLSGPEKISVYVFTDQSDYAEFVRSVENREVDLTSGDDQAHANLAVETPYVVVLDPLHGGPEPTASGSSRSKRIVRGKRSSLEPVGLAGGSDRTLAGLVVEQFGTGVVALSGNAPRWLSLGIGTYLAAAIEPRSAYYRRLRSQVSTITDQGWTPKARGILGGQGTEEEARAVGFSLLECLSTTSRPFLVPFVREIAKDGKQFDELIQKGLSATPDQFFQNWGYWVARNYPRDR